MEHALEGMPSSFRTRKDAEKAIRMLRTFGSEWRDGDYRVVVSGIKGPKRKARLDAKGTARPRSRIMGRFPKDNVIGPMMSAPGGYKYEKTSRDARRTPKKRALASLERAWVQHFKSGSGRAKHAGGRVHDAMQAAFGAGASDAEINKVIDRASEMTERHRGEQYRKYSSTGGERRDPVRREYPRVYFEKGAAWKKSTWRPGYYIVVGESTRGGAHLIDEDRASRPGELVYLLGKTPRGGALWALAKNTRPVRKRRA